MKEQPESTQNQVIYKIREENHSNKWNRNYC